ncbi:MAG: hypothetical protein M3507_05870 [Actinomycetota bacterium]|nr:hypothetical protein [Actinomycetota bacterium]
MPSTVGGRTPRTWSRQWREERGQHDRAAETHGRVVEALQMHMVQTLLVHDDPGDDRMAWFGPDPGHLAMQRNELEAMGVENPEQARLVDACVRAALGTGSDIRIVPAGELADGLGAVLRSRPRPSTSPCRHWRGQPMDHEERRASSRPSTRSK